ncbi:MAG: hypothetical protein RL885_16850 [Planctomycetota bacterium]
MEESKRHTAESEHRFHSYVGHRIPWYVRLIWLMFWIFAIYYTLVWAIPDIKENFLTPP